MKTIASFTVNHDLLDRGIYLSRIDGDAVTYDIRMKKPNSGSYLSNGALHTIEHLLATYVRNSRYSDNVIYAGPMGCRTGVYLVVRDSISHKTAIELIKSSFEYIKELEGEVPGSKRAVLDYRLIGKSERYFLLEITLHTGRHHQIRAQLARIGCPIRGDLKYGAPRSLPDGSISLHARRLVMEHPVSHQTIDVTAPLPPDPLWQAFDGI